MVKLNSLDKLTMTMSKSSQNKPSDPPDPGPDLEELRPDPGPDLEELRPDGAPKTTGIAIANQNGTGHGDVGTTKDPDPEGQVYSPSTNTCDYCDGPLVSKFVLPLGVGANTDEVKILCSNQCLTHFKALIYDCYKSAGLIKINRKPMYKCSVCFKEVASLDYTITSEQANSFSTLMKLDDSFKYEGNKCCEDCENALNKVTENVVRFSEIQHELHVQRQKFLNYILIERTNDCKPPEHSHKTNFTAIVLKAAEDIKRKRFQELLSKPTEVNENVCGNYDQVDSERLSSQESKVSDEDSNNPPSTTSTDEATTTTIESEPEIIEIEPTMSDANIANTISKTVNGYGSNGEANNTIIDGDETLPLNSSAAIQPCSTPMKELRVVCEDIVKSNSPVLAKRRRSSPLPDSKAQPNKSSPVKKSARRNNAPSSTASPSPTKTKITAPDSPPLKRRLRKRSKRSRYTDGDEEESQPESEVESVVTCTECNISFSSAELYRIHWEFRHVTVHCKHCKKEFQSKDSLETHLTEEHLKVNPFSVRFQRQALPRKSLKK